MRINGIQATESLLSISPLDNTQYYTLDGKIGGMCVGRDHVEWFKTTLAYYESYLEIGTFDGVALAAYAERWPTKKFVAIDSFETAYGTGSGHFEYVYENCKRLANVDVWVGRSSDVLPTLKEKFDVIFIDGAHDYTNIRSDYDMTWPLLNMNGMMIFHDIDLEGTLRVIEEVEKERGVKRQQTEVGVIYVVKK